jgi:thiamine biosynthesis lipoprotein
VIWLAAALAAPPDGFVMVSRPMMATAIEVVLPAEQVAAAEVVWAEFDLVERAANEWRPGTSIARLNDAAGGSSVVLEPETCALLRRGVEIGDLTGGAFDVTWAAMWDLWDFHAPNPAVPSDDLVRARATLVDHRSLLLTSDCRAWLPLAGMKVGLGGIAKGYALDRASDALLARGVADYSISAGGQVRVAGTAGGRPWRVGIRDPRGIAADAFALVEVTDTSVSTSGDYERYFVVDGVRYHHVLDPNTGWPTRGLRSATVVCADATLADALSTALLVLGRDAGLRLVASLDGVEAVVVDDAGAVHATPALAEALHLIHPPAAGPP